jgi:S-formylglutathione hydrolase FrmB
VATSFGPGAHDWAYWDARIQDVLAWLPPTGPAA